MVIPPLTSDTSALAGSVLSPSMWKDINISAKKSDGPRKSLTPTVKNTQRSISGPGESRGTPTHHRRERVVELIEVDGKRVSKTSTGKRKFHNKSKNGCANCKRRRVKCDETKPACKKCINMKLECVYLQNPQASLANDKRKGASNFQTVVTYVTRKPDGTIETETSIRTSDQVVHKVVDVPSNATLRGTDHPDSFDSTGVSRTSTSVSEGTEMSVEANSGNREEDLMKQDALSSLLVESNTRGHASTTNDDVQFIQHGAGSHQTISGNKGPQMTQKSESVPSSSHSFGFDQDTSRGSTTLASEPLNVISSTLTSRKTTGQNDSDITATDGNKVSGLTISSEKRSATEKVRPDVARISASPTSEASILSPNSLLPLSTTLPPNIVPSVLVSQKYPTPLSRFTQPQESQAVTQSERLGGLPGSQSSNLENIGAKTKDFDLSESPSRIWMGLGPGLVNNAEDLRSPLNGNSISNIPAAMSNISLNNGSISPRKILSGTTHTQQQLQYQLHQQLQLQQHQQLQLQQNHQLQLQQQQLQLQQKELLQRLLNQDTAQLQLVQKEIMSQPFPTTIDQSIIPSQIQQEFQNSRSNDRSNTPNAPLRLQEDSLSQLSRMGLDLKTLGNLPTAGIGGISYDFRELLGLKSNSVSNSRSKKVKEAEAMLANMEKQERENTKGRESAKLARGNSSNGSNHGEKGASSGVMAFGQDSGELDLNIKSPVPPIPQMIPSMKGGLSTSILSPSPSLPLSSGPIMSHIRTTGQSSNSMQSTFNGGQVVKGLHGSGTNLPETLSSNGMIRDNSSINDDQSQEKNDKDTDPSKTQSGIAKLLSLSTKANLNLVDMKLFHHYCTVVCSTITTSQVSAPEVWSKDVPELAFDHPYLMHSLLAFSASHLSRSEPGLEQYVYSHRLDALRLLREAVLDISEENADALIASALVLIMDSLANTSSNNPAISAKMSPSNWIFHVKGAATILTAVWPLSEKSRFYDLIAVDLRTLGDVLDGENGTVSKLICFDESIADLYPVDVNSPYLITLAYLDKLNRELNDSDFILRVFTFPALLDKTFLALLMTGDLNAMRIMRSYYKLLRGVTTKVKDKVWFLEGLSDVLPQDVDEYSGGGGMHMMLDFLGGGLPSMTTTNFSDLV